jgi:hypothetical protein
MMSDDVAIPASAVQSSRIRSFGGLKAWRATIWLSVRGPEYGVLAA